MSNDFSVDFSDFRVLYKLYAESVPYLLFKVLLCLTHARTHALRRGGMARSIGRVVMASFENLNVLQGKRVDGYYTVTPFHEHSGFRPANYQHSVDSSGRDS
jgi:hypothetical protein